jgi:uncharacterized membrane protein
MRVLTRRLLMERMLVVVFNEESKTYEGSRALNQLDGEGSIAIHAESVIRKNADGTVTVKQAEGDFPIRTIGGTALGSLVGLLGGPVGWAVGATAGAMAGSIGDVYAAGVDTDFLDDVAATLTPGKCAVVADVSEEWVTPVDTRMEALGGVVFRTARKDVQDDQRARDVASLREEIEQLKAEHAQARADHKAKLQAKIDNLNAKLQHKLEQAKQRSEQIKSEADAKVQALQKKVARAQGDAKAAMDARMTRIREEYEQAASKLRSLTAPQVKRAG